MPKHSPLVTADYAAVEERLLALGPAHWSIDAEKRARETPTERFARMYGIGRSPREPELQRLPSEINLQGPDVA